MKDFTHNAKIFKEPSIEVRATIDYDIYYRLYKIDKGEHDFSHALNCAIEHYVKANLHKMKKLSIDAKATIDSELLNKLSKIHNDECLSCTLNCVIKHYVEAMEVI